MLASGVTGLPGAQRVPLRPYIRLAGERREPSRGMDGLAAVVLDDTDRSPKSPGVEYTSLNNNVLRS